MRSILHLGLLGLLLLAGQAQAQSKDSPLQEYGDFLEILFYESTPYIKIKEVDPTRSHAMAVNGQSSFWEFITTNYIARLDYDALQQIKDTTVVEKQVMHHIEQDTTFNHLISTYQAKVIDQTQPKDTVTIDNVLNVAVKFFNITGINTQGHYTGRICVGIHALPKTEKKRSPYLEAFAFDAIINHLNSETYTFYDDYRESVYNVYKLNLGTNEEEQLLRTQGAIFIQMFQSPQLKQLLLDEYERKKDILPFILKAKTS
ncbi:MULTISPECIES: hypothetical protein [unclassified Myroides]|uniref:hypothetical protein n=1 Tax=unclassified Myroides TaxID=2642485 RepID=UPI003D2F847D